MKKHSLLLITLTCIVFVWSVTAQAADYRFILRVQPGKSMLVYQAPSQSSKVLTKLTAGHRSQIIKRQSGWLQIKIPLKGSNYAQGWVQQSNDTFKVFRQSMIAENNPPQARTAASKPPQKNLKTKSKTPIATPSKPQKTQKTKKQATKTSKKPKTKNSSDWDDWIASDAGYQASLRLGSIYNIKDYTGEKISFDDAQLRIGIAVEKMVATNLRLGVPVHFAFSSAFKTIETGLEASYYLFTKNALGVYFQAGSTYEYLFNGDKSFSGANLYGGLGIDYLINDRFMIGITPLSVEAMVWRSESNVPLNLRGQILLTLRTKW